MSTPLPPRASITPRPLNRHGRTYTDDYYWLRDRANPDVAAYLQAENAYTDELTVHLQGLRDTLLVELKGRIKETDLSVPQTRGDYVYFTRTQAGQQYPSYWRRRNGENEPDELLLDQNALAEGHSFCDIGMFRVSPDHNWLAYSVDLAGSEQFSLHFKNLKTGQILEESIPNTYYALEWANDSRTVFYSTLDAALRPCRLHRHLLGTDPAADALLYAEADESFFLWLTRSSSDHYLFLVLRNTTTAEIRFLSADDPAGEFRVFSPRQPGVDYSLFHHSDWFYILTNAAAPNFRVLVTPVGSLEPDHWRELIPHRPEAFMQTLLITRDFIVRLEREGGLQRLRVSAPMSAAYREFQFPEDIYAYEVDAAQQPPFGAVELRLTYQSLVTPPIVADIDLNRMQWRILKQQEIPSGHDPSRYEMKREWVEARDGARVPLTLLHRRDLAMDGNNPVLLYGYGAYGACVDPVFRANRFSLVDRGFVVAIAHIRGGAEMGRAWYDSGRMLNKKNTFNDFIDCAEFLISAGYTRPSRLACQGISAGGLLMGAVTNMRPDLFQAVIAEVPFVDVINTMSDPSIPLTVIEWEQWGNPAIEEQFEYMLSYSPYENVRAVAYPHLLVTAGFNDPRVAYWEPAKWVARLRALKTDANWLLLKTNMAAGHSGSSGRYDFLKEVAFTYAFLIDRLGA